MNLHPESLKVIIKEAILEALEEHDKKSHALNLSRLKNQMSANLEMNTQILEAQKDVGWVSEEYRKAYEQSQLTGVGIIRVESVPFEDVYVKPK